MPSYLSRRGTRLAGVRTPPPARAPYRGPVPAVCLAIAAALLAGACGGSDAGRGPTGGTVVVATSDPDNLFPPVAVSASARTVMDQIFDHLAEIGDGLNSIGDAGFKPRLASSWTWAPDSLSITFHLDPRARWHDGVPVRSGDVVFSVRTYLDSAAGATNRQDLANIDSVTAPDSLTAVIWYGTRQPTQFFDATYQIYILPAHLLKDIPAHELRTSPFARAPIGSGRFRFVRWVPTQELVVEADTTNFRGRARLDRIIFAPIPDANAAMTKLVAGEADVYETLRPEHLAQIASRPEIGTMSYPGADYAFLQFNLRDPRTPDRPHPLFAERELRRALTMALDRRSLVKAIFDSLAVVSMGPVTRSQFTADTTLAQLPFDTARANRTLDSLGWRDRNRDSVRVRNGRPLEFTLLVPSVSRNRVLMSVLIQEQLRRIGVGVRLEQLEFTTFLDREGKGTFEAVLGAWHTDPTPSSIRQTWTTSGLVATGGSNYGSYQSPVFDALVDSAVATMDTQRGRAYYRRAYQTIIDDAAAIWLYEPRYIGGVHRRIRPTGVRADAWWADMADWTIDPARRLPRDKIGLRAPSPPSTPTP